MLRNLFKSRDKDDVESDAGDTQKNWFNRLKSGLMKNTESVPVSVVGSPRCWQKD